MSWREAYFEQAWSDFNVYLDLNAGHAALCHKLHYLQMATEKLAKGFRCPARGGPHPRTHFVFVDFLRRLKNNPIYYYKRMGFNSKRAFSSHIENLLPASDLIEKLAPSGASFDKVNPEYPWVDQLGNVICPASYGFPELKKRELSMIQSLLVDLFHLEGYQRGAGT
jgi:hypothetical protein